MVDVYFPKGRGELRMPRSSRFERDGLGIRYEGEVLNGEKSVQERRRADELAAARRIFEGVDGVEGCDPVLRFHYRL